MSDDMLGMNDIIREAESLPVDERLLLVDSVLRTLNAPNPENDRQWAAVATQRLEELRTGLAKPVSGEEVFAKVQARFAAS